MSDKQHDGYRPKAFGMDVYFATTEEGSDHWRDMGGAFALLLQEQDPELKRKHVGASTGFTHLIRLAIKWLPEPAATELQRKYLIVRQIRLDKEETEKALHNPSQTPADPTT